MCDHAVKIRLTDVTVAIAPDGCLAGEARQKEHRCIPLRYSVLEFCANRVCEKVSKAERFK